MIKNLDHINIVVRSLNEAKQFFTNLGFIVEDEAELQGDWIARIVGFEQVHARYAKLAAPGSRTKLELIQYYHPASGNDSGIGKANQLGIRHFAFEVEDIEAVVGKLRNNGVTFLSDVQTYPITGKKLVYFYGPEGILLELAEYPKGAA